MDLETFEVFETSSVRTILRIESDKAVVEYWKVLERIKIVRAKGDI
jgi:translation initiation factor 5A